MMSAEDVAAIRSAPIVWAVYQDEAMDAPPWEYQDLRALFSTEEKANEYVDRKARRELEAYSAAAQSTRTLRPFAYGTRMRYGIGSTGNPPREAPPLTDEQRLAIYRDRYTIEPIKVDVNDGE